MQNQPGISSLSPLHQESSDIFPKKKGFTDSIYLMTINTIRLVHKPKKFMENTKRVRRLSLCSSKMKLKK